MSAPMNAIEIDLIGHVIAEFKKLDRASCIRVYRYAGWLIRDGEHLQVDNGGELPPDEVTP